MRICLVVLLFACGSKKEAPPPPPPAGSGSATPSAPSATSAATLPADLELPEVSGTGYRAVANPRIRITATQSAIAIDDKTVATLKSGALADADVPKLQEAAAPLGSLQETTASGVQVFHQRPLPVTLAIDRRVSYHTLAQIIAAVKPSGVDRFSILARSGGKQVIASLVLPEQTSSEAKPDAKPVKGPKWLGLVATVAGGKITVWSTSGLAGTLQQPKLALDGKPDDLAQLARTLADIASAYPNAPDRNQIMLMGDTTTTMQAFADVFGIAVATFPDVRMSTGFE
jgi:biopolymer transport protein ExbD